MPRRLLRSLSSACDYLDQIAAVNDDHLGASCTSSRGCRKPLIPASQETHDQPICVVPASPWLLKAMDAQDGASRLASPANAEPEFAREYSAAPVHSAVESELICTRLQLQQPDSIPSHGCSTSNLPLLSPLVPKRALPIADALPPSDTYPKDGSAFQKIQDSVISNLHNELDAILDVDPGLSDEQRAVLHHIYQGRSVFFTGGAGTGKSFLLRHAIQLLRSKCAGSGEIAVTASTGLAAVNIGGTTIHSWSGVGLGDKPREVLLDDVQKSKNSWQPFGRFGNWLNVKTLVIDEISMLDGYLFDTLDLLASEVRRDGASFGGIQLVLCGDFFQLPPVGLSQGKGSFCFDSACWSRIFPPANIFVLSHVFRQREPVFVRVLNEIRRGCVSAQTFHLLRSTALQTFTGPIQPIQLFSHNAAANKVNEQRLEELEGDPVSFEAVDRGEHPYLRQLQTHCRAPGRLVLKIGAQVMLTRNVHGLANGTRGVVLGFGTDESKELLPVVQMHVPREKPLVLRLRKENWRIEAKDKSVACRQQIPLCLAWAISIHKSQGMTIDALETDLGSVFDFGQAYVALSRATCLERLRVKNFTPSGVKVHPRVLQFDQSLMKEESLRSHFSDSAKRRRMLP